MPVEPLLTIASAPVNATQGADLFKNQVLNQTDRDSDFRAELDRAQDNQRYRDAQQRPDSSRQTREQDRNRSRNQAERNQSVRDQQERESQQVRRNEQHHRADGAETDTRKTGNRLPEGSADEQPPSTTRKDLAADDKTDQRLEVEGADLITISTEKQTQEPEGDLPVDLELDPSMMVNLPISSDPENETGEEEPVEEYLVDHLTAKAGEQSAQPVDPDMLGNPRNSESLQAPGQQVIDPEGILDNRAESVQQGTDHSKKADAQATPDPIAQTVESPVADEMDKWFDEHLQNQKLATDKASGRILPESTVLPKELETKQALPNQQATLDSTAAQAKEGMQAAAQVKEGMQAAAQVTIEKTSVKPVVAQLRSVVVPEQPVDEMRRNLDQSKSVSDISGQLKTIPEMTGQSSESARPGGQRDIPFKTDQLAQSLRTIMLDESQGSERVDDAVKAEHRATTNRESLMNGIDALKNLNLSEPAAPARGAESADLPEGAVKSESVGALASMAHNSKSDTMKEVQAQIKTPLHSPKWAGEVGQRLMMMVNHKLQQADIQIDPPELGPMAVKIKFTHEQAHVVFTSHFASVRDTLEQAIPRLREMFDQNGVGLGDVDVQDQGARDGFNDQSAQQADDYDEGQAAEAGFQPAVEDNGDHAVVRASVNMVDYYA